MIVDAVCYIVKSFWVAGVSAAANSLVTAISDSGWKSSVSEHSSWREFRNGATPKIKQQQSFSFTNYAAPQPPLPSSPLSPQVQQQPTRQPAHHIDYDEYTL